jgi:hypothetical protein
MEGINYLIEKTKPIVRISELSSVVKEIEPPHAPGCIQCLICGIKSGTLRIISHTYRCKYRVIVENGPFIYADNPNFGTIKINADRSIGILQREYGITNKYKDKNIIGTFGAGSCIILCIRNRETTDTFLAHIDSMTHPGENWGVSNFYTRFTPSKSDVYIIGGNDSTKDIIYKLLVELTRMEYKIKFSYIIDNSSNNFAINSITGEIYTNQDIDPIKDLPLVYNVNERMSMLKFIPLFIYKLNQVHLN